MGTRCSGSRTTYSHGCRCTLCKEANRRYFEERRTQDPTVAARYLERGRDYRNNNRDDLKAKQFVTRYGITLDERDALLARQGGLCAICQTSEFGAKGPQLDHDHVTKRVRGVLCMKCNLGIGCFDDRDDKLTAAIAYLEHRKDIK